MDQSFNQSLLVSVLSIALSLQKQLPFSTMTTTDMVNMDTNKSKTLTTENSSSTATTMLETLKSTSVKKRHTSQTRIACYLTLATMALIAFTTLSVHTMNYINPGSTSSLYSPTRHLDEKDDNDEDDYSAYTCDDMFRLTEAGSDERCLFSKTCNSNQGLQFNFIFCNTYNLSTTTWILILSPFLTIWLILLFRMLGSTAEEFFSPSLEMFSMKMGLPPRFSGVTLLALGNGAADVSATMSAIVLNPEKGYEMSLGALTGAGMFVGTVVAGIVIVIADGVKCRGALVRDVLMFVLTLVVVYSFFDEGKIGSVAVNTFLWMYIAFVIVVLVADVYHRAVVLPRLRKYELEQSRMNMDTSDGDDDSEERNTDGFEGVALSEGELSDGSGNSVGSKKVTFASVDDAGDVELAQTHKTQKQSSQNSPLTAPDNMDEENNNVNSSLKPAATNTNISSVEHNEIDEFFTDNPNATQNEDSTEDGSNPENKKKKKKGMFRKMFSRKKKKSKMNPVQKAVDTIMIGLSNYAPGEGNPNVNKSFKGWSEGLEVTSNSADKPVKLHGTHGILNTKMSEEIQTEEHNEFNEPSSSYRILLENVDNMCTADGVTSSGLDKSWGNSFSGGWEEIKQHFRDYIKDIFDNEENNAFDKFFLVCELPFTFLRKISVSIPCDDYYCRGLVAVSFAFAPLWFGVYSVLEKNSNWFFSGGYPVIEIATLIFSLVAILIFKFAPDEGKDMSLTVSVRYQISCSLYILGYFMETQHTDYVFGFLNFYATLGAYCFYRFYHCRNMDRYHC